MDGLEHPKPSPRNFSARGLVNQKADKLMREGEEKLFGKSKKQERADRKLSSGSVVLDAPVSESILTSEPQSNLVTENLPDDDVVNASAK